MLNRLPDHLGSFEQLRAMLGRPSPRELARALDVSERTVYRWIAADQAPRAVMAALYWLTDYGRAELLGHAEYGARLAHQLAASLQRELNAARAHIERLERIGQFGSANAPSYATRSRLPRLQGYQSTRSDGWRAFAVVATRTPPQPAAVAGLD